MKIINILERTVIYSCVFLMALFVIPFFPASFVLPREILLTLSVILLLILWSVKLVMTGSLAFAKGKYDWPVLLITLVYLVSAIFVTPNKMEAFWYPGTATFVTASALLYFFVNQLKKEEKEGVAVSLFFSGVVFSLLILLSTLGVFTKIKFLPEIMKATTFNTLGGTIPAIIFLISLLPLAVNFVLKNKDLAKKLFFSVSSIIVVFGLMISVKNTIPAKDQRLGLLDYSTSWQILVDTLKFSPVLGTGPGNYVTAFSRFKPLAFNTSTFWANSFNSSRNLYLTATTEAGLAAAIAFFLLLLTVYKTDLKKRLADIKAWPLILFLLLAFIFPVASFAITLLFILLSLFSDSNEKIFNVNFLAREEGLSSSISSRLPSLIVALPVIFLALAVFYFGTRYSLAEYRFQEALNAVNKNDAKIAVDKMVAAINLNPKVDRYRFSYSQINLAIAQNIASKKELSESDKSNISQLIQAAISEGKNMVSLNPTRAENWAFLADIYRSVMSFAQGADQFAIQTYTQAIALDPVNPNLRIALGGIYYALGQYDSAIESFKLATLAKSDLPNAHFNLAVAYRDKKDYANALAEMNATLALIDKESTDYKTVKDEIDKLEPLVKEIQADSTKEGTLIAPQKAPEPVVQPPLELPEDATPPVTQ